MPPASKTRRGGAASSQKKHSQTFKLAPAFASAFLTSQRQEEDVSAPLVDTRLIFSDGYCDIHAAFLSALSPFFFKCVASQGDNYTNTRVVLLPDFTLAQITPMIQLLYTGAVALPSDDAVNELRGLLAFFEIDIQDYLKSTSLALLGTSATTTTPTILSHKGPPEQVLHPPAPPKIPPNPKETRFNLRPRPHDRKQNYNDSDWCPESEEEETVVEPIQTVPPVLATPSPVKPSPPAQGVMNLPQNINCASPAASTSTSASTTASTDSKKPKKKRKPWVEPNYDDKVWLATEARRCQVCSKRYKIPSEASGCITSHGRLRCYFCFKVSSSTETLFDHLKRRHRQAGKDGYILCPYCDQSVAHKSVSCHMISTHLNVLTAEGLPKEEHGSGRKTEKPKPVRTSSGSSSGSAVAVSTGSGGGSCPSTPKPVVRIPYVVLFKTPSRGNTPVSPPTGGPSPKKPKMDENKVDQVPVNIMAPPPAPPTPLYQIIGEGRGSRVVPKNMDVTVKRPGLDGKLWVWRIQRNYNTNPIHHPVRG